MNSVAKALATALGAGYSPVAPGTCGTIVAIPLAWALAPLVMWQFLLVTAAITLLAIWAAHRADLAERAKPADRIEEHVLHQIVDLVGPAEKPPPDLGDVGRKAPEDGVQIAGIDRIR